MKNKATKKPRRKSKFTMKDAMLRIGRQERGIKDLEKKIDDIQAASVSALRKHNKASYDLIETLKEVKEARDHFSDQLRIKNNAFTRIKDRLFGITNAQRDNDIKVIRDTLELALRDHRDLRDNIVDKLNILKNNIFAAVETVHELEKEMTERAEKKAIAMEEAK